MAVSLETAVECLKDERLSRKSRFVDVLYRGCESWRNFAVTRVKDATVIAAYDEETRLWSSDPDVVERSFRTTILVEARELQRKGHVASCLISAEASSTSEEDTPSASSRKRKWTRRGVIDDDSSSSEEREEVSDGSNGRDDESGTDAQPEKA